MRSIYRDTITVYNRRFTAINQPPFPPDKPYWERTVIKGVRFRNNRQIDKTSEGAVFIAQTISVTIPKKADQSGKTYVSPNDYAQLPQDDRLHWTIRLDKSSPDFIVLGEGPEITDSYTVDTLQREYGNRRIMRPQALRGSDESGIPQWKVTGV